MGCCDKNRKYNCYTKTQAICTMYKGYIPKYSKLKDEECVTVEETIEELYENQENILDSINLDNLGKDCLDYDYEDKLKVKDVLLEYEKQICTIKDQIGGSEENLELDFKCLVNPCGTLNSLNDLLQILINEICNLKSIVENGE